MTKRGWKARYDSPKRREARRKKARRKERLSAPIPERDVVRFTKHLIAVTFGGVECWFYVPAGRTGTMPEELAFSTVDYATATCNGEQVNAHRFAYAAHHGVTYASLEGWDVHHITGCIGYRCQNPAHLEKKPMREHRGSRGVSGSLIRYQITLMESAIGQPLTGGSDRTLAGVPFKIRGGIMDSVIRQEWTAPTVDVLFDDRKD